MSSVMEKLLNMWKERLKALRLQMLMLTLVNGDGVCCD